MAISTSFFQLVVGIMLGKTAIKKIICMYEKLTIISIELNGYLGGMQRSFLQVLKTIEKYGLRKYNQIWKKLFGK